MLDINKSLSLVIYNPKILPNPGIDPESPIYFCIERQVLYQEHHLESPLEVTPALGFTYMKLRTNT